MGFLLLYLIFFSNMPPKVLSDFQFLEILSCWQTTAELQEIHLQII